MQSTIMSALAAAALVSLSFAAPAPQITYPLPSTASLHFIPPTSAAETYFTGVPASLNADITAGGTIWILQSNNPPNTMTPLTVDVGSPDNTLVAAGPGGRTTWNLAYAADGLLVLTMNPGSAFTQISDILMPQPVNGAAPSSQWIACATTAGDISGWNIFWAPLMVGHHDCHEIDIGMQTY